MGYGQDSVKISSPWHAVYNHLKYLQDDSFNPNIAANSIHPEGWTKEERLDLSIKLKQILEGEGIYIDLEIIPKNVNHLDSTSNLNRYYISPKKFPEMYVEKLGDSWFYSKRTSQMIGIWHKQVFPYGTDRILELLPKEGNTKYFGLYLWQYIGLFIIILLTFVLHRVFTFLIEKIFIRLLKTFGYERLADQVMKRVARPVSVLILFPLLMILIPVLQLPVKMSAFIVTGLRVVWPVFAIIFFYRLVDIFCEYLTKLASKTESTLDDQLVPLIRKSLKTFVVIIGLLVILDNLDVNITGIIAGLSIGGLAFALAAQDTIKNFFGSLMIFFDRPFQVGDWITSGDVDGTVEEVGFRATRIRTFRNSVMYIPNGVITNQMIDNHGLRVYRRFFTQLAVKYDTPPELLQAFVDGLKQIVGNHNDTRKDYHEIHVNNLGDNAIEVMFYIFFSVPNWSEELRARHEVILLVVKLADRLGVDFAFPTQTLHVESVPDKMIKIEYDRDKASLKEKIQGFLAQEFKSKKGD
jgi:MscS family membrane protein